MSDMEQAPQENLTELISRHIVRNMYETVAIINPETGTVWHYDAWHEYAARTAVSYAQTQENEIRDHVHPDDVKLYRKATAMDRILKELADNAQYTMTVRYREQDGVSPRKFLQYSWLDENRKRIFATVTDVTRQYEEERHRKEAEEALRAQAESDAEIIRKSSMDAYDFLAVIDVDKEVIELRGGSWFNENVPTPENMRKLPYKQLLAFIAQNYAEDTEAGKEFVRKFELPKIERVLETEKEYFIPFNFLDADNKQRIKYKQFRFSWLSEKKQRLLAARADVTASMEKEKLTNQRMRDALAAAEAANAAKSEFLSRMSHDIRTPMNAIIGFSTLLMKNADDPEKVRDQSRKILSSSNHLLGLINDVLDMSKIETGKFQLNVHPFHLSETVTMVDSIMRPQMQAKKQRFDVYVSGARHDEFLGDDQRIQQILINILSNATKYTPEGGEIVMRVRSMPETSGRYETFQFEIADTGRGMTEEYQKVIFEPFSQEKLKGSENVQGTGLGMAITRNMVNMMGGSIRVQSELGKGSTFTVAIPLQLPDEERDYAFWQTHSLTHMLVVDDEEEVCRNVMEAMEGTGVRMEYSLDGEESVRILTGAEAIGDGFNLVLLDWKMPGINGVETARRIRKTLPPDVLIIILTAYDYSEIEDEARAAGVDGFMPKPFFLQSLERAVEATGRLKEPGVEAESAEAAEEEIRLDGMNILAAEDNELNAEILTELMNMHGANVTVYPDGQEAVKAFREAEPGTYDLILMDIQMPVMDGYEATKRIRAMAGEEGLNPDKQKEAAEIPVIAMTANAFVEDVQKSLQCGMNAHVAKPLNIRALKTTIAEARKK